MESRREDLIVILGMRVGAGRVEPQRCARGGHRLSHSVLRRLGKGIERHRLERHRLERRRLEQRDGQMVVHIRQARLMARLGGA